MLRLKLRITKMAKVRNEYVGRSLKAAPVVNKLKGNRLSCYEHVMRRKETYVVIKVRDMNVEEWKRRGRPNNR